MEVLRDIPWKFDEAKFFKSALIEEAGLFEEASGIVEAVVPLLKPKAVFDELFVDERGEDWVKLGGVTFTSAVLKRNLDGIHKVFPFIVTCGTEAEGMDLSGFDFLASYWLDRIKEMALREASAHLRGLLAERSGFRNLASINPGSGEADLWPIRQQTRLFSLFPGVTEAIGVRLTESCLMVPNKSVSGILFPAEVDFVNCQYCTRANCPNRKAPRLESFSLH